MPGPVCQDVLISRPSAPQAGGQHKQHAVRRASRGCASTAKPTSMLPGLLCLGWLGLCLGWLGLLRSGLPAPCRAGGALLVLGSRQRTCTGARGFSPAASRAGPAPVRAGTPAYMSVLVAAPHCSWCSYSRLACCLSSSPRRSPWDMRAGGGGSASARCSQDARLAQAPASGGVCAPTRAGRTPPTGSVMPGTLRGLLASASACLAAASASRLARSLSAASCAFVAACAAHAACSRPPPGEGSAACRQGAHRLTPELRRAQGQGRPACKPGPAQGCSRTGWRTRLGPAVPPAAEAHPLLCSCAKVGALLSGLRRFTGTVASSSSSSSEEELSAVGSAILAVTGSWRLPCACLRRRYHRGGPAQNAQDFCVRCLLQP